MADDLTHLKAIVTTDQVRLRFTTMRDDGVHATELNLTHAATWTLWRTLSRIVLTASPAESPDG